MQVITTALHWVVAKIHRDLLDHLFNKVLGVSIWLSASTQINFF